MKKVTYYRLQKNGDYFNLYYSLKEAKENIFKCLHYKEEEKSLWSIKEFTSMIKEVSGELQNWGSDEKPRFHVSWECPSCGKTHHTDITPSQIEKNEALWFCEYTENIHLVYWESHVDF